MGSRFADSVRFIPTLGGTTDWVYSANVQGYNNPTTGACVNGDPYSIRAESADLSQWEESIGTFNSGTGTFTRATVLYNSSGTGTRQGGAGTKINFTLAPQVAVVALAEDLPAAPMLSGYINGLTLSTAGSSTTFSVATGMAIDANNTDYMELRTAISKTTSAWAVGSGNGGLDTGSIAASTWYHAFLIKRIDTGVVDVLVSLSVSAPTMPTNYTVARRIGSMKTNGSSQWTAFTQIGNKFYWATSVLDLNAANVGTTPTLETCTVPPGVNVDVLFRGAYTNTAANSFCQFASPLAQNTVNTVGSLANAVASVAAEAEFSITTNTSAQIYVVNSTASGNSTWILTYGWIDNRNGPNISGIPQATNLLGTLKGYIAGLQMSQASTTTIQVAAGIATDSTAVQMMSLVSAITKSTSAWAVGSGNGGLDTGSIAASTWYHFYLIQRLDTGVVDVLFSLSASAPTMPSSYTLSRRIGSMKTNGSSQWPAFIQNGNEFLWSVPVQDINASAVGTSATIFTLGSVPTGIKVNALIEGNLLATGAAWNGSIFAGDVSGASGFNFNAASGTSASQSMNVRTNTSAQVQAIVSTTGGSANIWTQGWVDLRGTL